MEVRQGIRDCCTHHLCCSWLAPMLPEVIQERSQRKKVCVFNKDENTTPVKEVRRRALLKRTITSAYSIYQSCSASGPGLSLWMCEFPTSLYGLICCCLFAKSCPTPCDSMGCSPPGSSVQGISQARILEWEWVAIPFSRGSSQPRDGMRVSCIGR